jgi:hypothetical protein
MLLFIRIFLVLYGIIALGTGFLGISAAFDPASAPATDNNHRFVAAIWGAMSIAFFYVAYNPSEVAFFRFLMLALFMGGLVRTYGLRYYPATPFMIFGILLELVPTAIMLWMHTKLLNEGAL